VDIKIGPYMLGISLRKPETHVDILGREWKPKPPIHFITGFSTDYFQMVDEICYGAKPDDLCDLCLAPMGDKFKPGEENLCERCR
jgi:hypothetical protein